MSRMSFRIVVGLLIAMVALLVAHTVQAEARSSAVPSPITPTPTPVILRFSDVKTSASAATIKPSESLALTTTFKLTGVMRNEFVPKIWHGDALAIGGWACDGRKCTYPYTLKFKVSVRGWRKYFPDDEIIKPVTFTRTAQPLGASETCAEKESPDPDYAYGLRITLEDGTEVLTCDPKKAQALLFDVTRTFQIKGSQLRLATNQLFAQIEVSWTGALTWTEFGRMLKLPLKLDNSNSPWVAVKVMK